jgi:predicted membrane protein
MEKQMMTRFDTPRRRASRVLVGLTVIGIGTLALLDNLHLFDLALLMTFWPLAFVIWGVFNFAWAQQPGARPFGLLLMLMGALMTAHNLGHEGMGLKQWWPVFIILAGLSIALRAWFPGTGVERARFESSVIEHTDEVNVNAQLSGVVLRNDSRSFKGGRIAVTFGGLQLDLREAVMEVPEVTIFVDAKFSGIELRVPRDWQVMVQMRAAWGAVEDKTETPTVAHHRLVLRGETVFGGFEIKN